MPLPVYGRVDLVIEHILQLFEKALALFVVILFQGPLELLQGLTLGAAELLGDLDLALDVHITAASAIHILDALAAQAEGGAALGAFRHIDLDLAVDGRHRDGIAQDSLTVGDGEDDVDIVLVALEHLAGLDSHRHDDVTCGAAVGAGIAHAREAEALIVVDARRDIGLQSLLDRDGAAAVAALAGVLDELALAAAAGAGLLGLHDAEGRTLLTNDKASAAAVRAGLRAGTGGAAAAVALGALLLAGDGDVLLAAMHRLVKRQGDAHPDVLALAGGVGIRGTARAAKTAEAAAKDVAENIGVFARSTISRRRVLATAPIHPAVAASFLGLLNITENPKTPQKLAASRKRICTGTCKFNVRKSTGCNFKISAIIQAVIVATVIIMIA